MGLLSKHIVMVTGKGGVGKSTVAAALALRAAREKKKVLLVELGEESFYSQFFGLQGIHHVPKHVESLGYDVALWDTDSCLREYVLHYIKIEGLFRIFFENRVMRTFINVAPALKELAILGKLTSGERHVGPEFHYDLVVVDAYATGHTLALLRAPKGMSESIKTGPMGFHSSQILRVLKDPLLTSYVVVTLPDELPTVEALELSNTLKQEFGVSPEICVNRILNPPLSSAEISQLNQDLPKTTGLGAFVRYLETVTRRQAQNISRLKDSHFEVLEVPLMHRATTSAQLITSIAEVFES